MTYIKLKVQSGETIIGGIELEHLDNEEEVVERKMVKGLVLSDILTTVSNGQLSLGELEVNLDFDENGSLILLEFYT